MTSAALLMIDMQNSYLAKDGVRDALGWPPIWRLQDTITACTDLLAAARAQGMQVIYSRSTSGTAGPLGQSPRMARLLAHRSHLIPEVGAAEQEWNLQIMDAVAPQQGDVVLDKTRASFFDYTELDPLLHNLGVQRLVVAGLQKNVCVEATARAALARNFEVAVPSDAVSTDGPALHEGALNSLRVLYTEVAPWREILAPDAAWDRAFTTPNYGRDPAYWTEATVTT